MNYTDEIQLQHETMKLLNKNNSSKCTFHFENTKDQKGYHLHLLSYNPLHNKKFLFHSEVGGDKLDAHIKMLKFVQELPGSKDNNNYKIVWGNKKEGKKITSYFFGKSEFDALHKLYYKENKDNVIFFSMEVSPSS